MSTFSLHPQLAADCHQVGVLDLSVVLLLDDSRYPWVVLVPQVEGITELYQLAPEQRQLLLDESCRVGELMMRSFAGDKLNVGALGNLVPQLHLHHVVRNRTDPAWPGPVWGHSAAVPYPTALLEQRLDLLRTGLALSG